MYNSNSSSELRVLGKQYDVKNYFAEGKLKYDLKLYCLILIHIFMLENIAKKPGVDQVFYTRIK